MLPSIHTLVDLKRFLKRLRKREADAVVEGRPIQLFGIEGCLVRYGVEVPVVDYKGDGGVDVCAEEVFELQRLSAGWQGVFCGERDAENFPFVVPMGSYARVCAIVQVIGCMADEELVAGFKLDLSYHSFVLRNVWFCADHREAPVTWPSFSFMVDCDDIIAIVH